MILDILMRHARKMMMLRITRSNTEKRIPKFLIHLSTLKRQFQPRQFCANLESQTRKSVGTISGGGSLKQINYPGTGNNSQFTYDPLQRNVKIVEVSGGSTTSTKQFLWNGFGRCEERNGGGTITKQFFIRGETINGTSYFYSKDHLGSVCEMTDSIGNIQAQYAFDPYGTTSKLQASIPSDFQYAGYYFHPQSLLNLTLRRAYNTSFGRWISRDPIDEWVDTNLFGYVANAPVSSTDDLGLSAEPPVKGKQKPKAATECEEAKRKKCEECCRENFHYSLDEADWLLGQGFITQKHYDAKVAAATKAWDNCLQECIEDPDSCKPRGKFTPPGAPTAPTGGGNPPNGTPPPPNNTPPPQTSPPDQADSSGKGSGGGASGGANGGTSGSASGGRGGGGTRSW